MKKFKVLSMVVAMLLAVAMLAGCNNGGQPANTGEPGKLEPTVEEGTDGKITKDPLELSIFFHMGTWGAYDPEKWVIYPEAAKFTNISLRGVVSSANTDTAQEFNTMIATPPYPDIIHGSKDRINKYAVESGVFIPLDELIKEHAPDIQKFLDANPWARAGSVAADDNLYFIPNSYQGIPSVAFFVREDWLTKLNIPIPETYEDYYNMLKAFREQDPNGNGQKDEIPYINREKSIDGLIQFWNAWNGWYAHEDNKIFHGKTQPEYRTAMEELHKWYAEGLIDQEVFTRGSKSRDILFGDNTGGSTHDWLSSTAGFNLTFQDSIPGFKLIVIPPPKDVNGVSKQIYTRQALSGQGWGISKDNKYPVETIKYMNFWFTEKGQRLFSYGIEDVDYTMVDGKPVPTEAVTKAPDGPPTYLRNRGQSEIGTQMLIDAEVSIMSEEAKKGFEMYNNEGFCVEQLPKVAYTEAEQATITDKTVAFDTFINEKQQAWLLGTEELNDTTWAQYLEACDAMGYKELQKAVQDAFDRYNAL